jgi:hypothetical protein
MSKMEWARFLDAHFRPHLVAVDLGTASSNKSGQHLVAKLERLAKSLGTTGNYAIHAKGRMANIAFERDVDALSFGEALGAQEAKRSSDEWASRWSCSFDRDGQLKVLTALKKLRLKAAGQRGGPMTFRVRKDR